MLNQKTCEQVFRSLQDLKQSIYSGWVLFLADLRSQYRDSFLGVLWIVAPIVMTGLAFIFLKNIGVVRFEAHDMNYSAYAFTGITLWQIFTSGVHDPIRFLSKQKKSLLNSRFHIYTIYFQALFHGLFELIFKYGALFLILAIVAKPGIGFIFPGFLMVLSILLIGYSIGVLAAPVASMFADTSRLIDIALLLLFLVTPIFHNGSKNAVLTHILVLNPLYYVFHSARLMLVSSEGVYIFRYIGIVGVAFALLLVGLYLGAKLRFFIVERS